MKTRILRGENELTGNLIEISTENTKILVECGVSLQGEKDVISPVEEQVLATDYASVIISHNHLDHNGLISKVKKNIPVYMGKISTDLYKLQNQEEDYSNFKTYEDGISFQVGDITIKPYLCDHSVPDSYMLLFEANGQSILYTGDFRASGRKNFNKLLERLPSKVDMLITENTNAYAKKCYSENDIEKKMTEFIKSTDKPVFVLCPTTNIDRIVSAYKATVKNMRDFYVDPEQEVKLEKVGGKVPNARNFEKVKIYKSQPTNGISKLLDFIPKYSVLVQELEEKSVTEEEIAKINNYTMLLKTSTLPYLRRMVKVGADVKDATLIYSMWSGYKETDSMKNFLSEIEKLGIKTITMHASGHADYKAIEALKNRVNPDETKVVHTGGKGND